METGTKERYSIKIADIQMSILSDEPEEFVRSVVAQLDARVSELTVQNKRCSKLDASLLCALDALGEQMKDEKKIKNLEAQISLYEANIRRLREELEEARRAVEMALLSSAAKQEEKQPPEAPASHAPEAARKEEAKSEPETARPGIHDAKLRQIEELLRNRREGTGAAAAAAENAAAPESGARDAKLREIEELLRKSGGARSLSEALQNAAHD